MNTPFKRIFFAAVLSFSFILTAQTRVKTYAPIRASYSNKVIQLSNANNETLETLILQGESEVRVRMSKLEVEKIVQLIKSVRAYTERIRRGERLTYADEVVLPEHKIQLTKYITFTNLDYVFCINSAAQEACVSLNAPKLSQLHELYRAIYKDMFDMEQRSTVPPAVQTPIAVNQTTQPIETSAVADETVYQSVEEPPVLIGGIQSLLANLKYPEYAVQNNIQGVVMVGFMVDETGTVRNAKIVQSLGYGCDEEAMHLVENARFLPGLRHGNPVKVNMFIPFTFKIENQGQ